MTATDISRRALERLDAKATRRGLMVALGSPTDFLGESGGAGLRPAQGPPTGRARIGGRIRGAAPPGYPRRARPRTPQDFPRQVLGVECQHADANALDPFEAGAFDLVSAQYASIPRTPDGRGVRNLLNAVAPGGTLLVVSHDLEPMRAPIDTSTHSRAFDPDACVRVDDIVAAIADSSAWDIEVHETRPRPP